MINSENNNFFDLNEALKVENLKINGLDKYKFIKTLKNLKSSNEVVNFYVRENFNLQNIFKIIIIIN